MTILQALTQADRLRPNEIDAEQKLRWLSTLDGQIHRELLESYQTQSLPFSGYDAQTELCTTQLLVPFPYDDLYLRYLVMRIDLEQGELELYNHDAAGFNRIWQRYAAHHGRTYTPKGESRLRF